jgi:AraC family transcriptional regulator
MSFNTRAELEDQMIVRGRNNRYYHHNPTPGLSIKTMRNGYAMYTIEGGKFAVNDDAYLILNSAQAYTIEIDSHTIINSFCVFFPDGWSEDIYRTFTTSTDQLLNGANGLRAVSFFERLQPHDEVVSPLMNTLHVALADPVTSLGWLEEKLRLLLRQMLQSQYSLVQEAEKIPAARYSTRIELYRRLHLARDYIHASLNQPVNLEEIARVAALSPYHFLRTFKQVFGQTPHEYLTHQRLDRARFLLASSNRSVTDICFEVGFESPGSFSTLFRRYTGMSPRSYRLQIAR